MGVQLLLGRLVVKCLCSGHCPDVLCFSDATCRQLSCRHLNYLDEKQTEVFDTLLATKYLLIAQARRCAIDKGQSELAAQKPSCAAPRICLISLLP